MNDLNGPNAVRLTVLLPFYTRLITHIIQRESKLKSPNGRPAPHRPKPSTHLQYSTYIALHLMMRCTSAKHRRTCHVKSFNLLRRRTKMSNVTVGSYGYKISSAGTHGGKCGWKQGLTFRFDLKKAFILGLMHDGYWTCAACILVRHVISLSITMLHLNIRGTFQTLECSKKFKFKNKHSQCVTYAIFMPYTASTLVPVYDLSALR
jgi:hypothetical protein